MEIWRRSRSISLANDRGACRKSLHFTATSGLIRHPADILDDDLRDQSMDNEAVSALEEHPWHRTLAPSRDFDDLCLER